jgi:hypothetical protein
VERIARTHCKRGHPLVEENVIRVGPKQHRRCRTCQIAKQAERRLRELRWLNGPRVVVSAMPAHDIWGPRVLPWSKLDAIEHGPRRRFNPWARSFESPFTPPALWQEIFAQVRPTPAEMEGR